MSAKRRQIKLTYVNTGESVIAELLDDEAPNVCKHIWENLPIEGKTIHGMYSGLEVFVMLDNPQPMPGRKHGAVAIAWGVALFLRCQHRSCGSEEASCRISFDLWPWRSVARSRRSAYALQFICENSW